MKKLLSTLRIATALVLSVFSSNILPQTAQAYSLSNPDGDYKKVYVCKYVGTPGVDERLQTGDNPISVSTSALKGFTGLGSFFNDEQGRSVAIAWDNGDHVEPPVSMCPAPEGPLNLPSAPTPLAPTCDAAGSLTLPANTTDIHWSISPAYTGPGTYDVTATAQGGKQFVGGGTTATFEGIVVQPQLTGEDCPSTNTEATAEAVTFTDSCGTASDTYTIPTVTGVSYFVNGSATAAQSGAHAATGHVSIVAQAQAGFELTAPYTFTHDFSSAPCVVPCEAAANGGVVTQETSGWTTSSNAHFVNGGVEMTSSDWNDSLVTYTHSYPVSQAPTLAWNVTGESSVTGAYGIGIILKTSSGAYIHYEPSPYTDSFWTNTPGLLPANAGGQGGPYSGSLQDLLNTVGGDVTIVETSFIFTSASENTITLKSLSFNCATYTFNKVDRCDENCGGEEDKKVFVCKYVGTPGISERLQTGQNPISVSVNSIKDFNGIGSYFNDAQGRSYVLAYDNGQPEPSASECPGNEKPSTQVLVPVCVEKDHTTSVTIRVFNHNDYAVTYKVVVEQPDGTGTNELVASIPANGSHDFTFNGYGVGTFDYTVYEGTQVESSSTLLRPLTQVPQTEFTWKQVFTHNFTIALCQPEQPPVVDVCLNLPGNQTTVPEGYVKDGDNCARVLGTTDVCPNIEGTQTSVPVGMVKDTNGNCVSPVTPPVGGAGAGQVLGEALPAELPATGGTNLPNPLLSIVAGFLTYLFLKSRNTRKAEA